MSATVFYNDGAELATLTNTFAVAGVATDPDAVSLIVTPPSGVAVTKTYPVDITRASAGVYTIDVSCADTVDGMWTAVWIGTGAASDVQPVSWTVFGSTVAKRYCSVEELKSRIKVGDVADDLELALAIEAASRGIDEMCGRRFWRGTETRTYVACDWYRVEVDDLVSVTTLKTDNDQDGVYETTWTTSQYQLLPVNPLAYTETRPYTCVKAIGATFPLSLYSPGTRTDLVQVTGVFGWPAVPFAVKQACLVAAQELFRLKGASFGVANVDQFGPIRVRENPRVLALLAPYRRDPFLVA